jgi:hypothetical protein
MAADDLRLVLADAEPDPVVSDGSEVKLSWMFVTFLVLGTGRVFMPNFLASAAFKTDARVPIFILALIASSMGS